MRRNYLKVAVVLALSLFSQLCQAQDSLRLTLPQAEKIFLQQNLSLLAQRYNIDMAKAQVIQAKLYNNPNIQFEGNIYNPQQRKAFNIGNPYGQYTVEVTQLITLAGKRNKQVKMAQTNVLLEESRFFDLLRTLQFTLRSNFYQLYFLQQSINGYALQVSYLEKLNTAHQELLAKGVVTLKDAVRIKSLLYTLKAEQTSLQNQVNEINAELQLLLQNKAPLIPVVNQLDVASELKRYSLASLLDTATASRYDLKEAQQSLVYSQQNYALQKAMAVPDVTLGAQFDKRGSFVDNATFFTVGIDLPFFNRNQGNIKSAKVNIDQSKVVLQLQNETLRKEVQSAYLKAINTNQMIQSFDPGFVQELQKLLVSVTNGFQRKDLSLLEFTDFYESYKDNLVQFYQLQNEQMQAVETLQFAVGKTIFNY
ncbi:TolC family protein [Pedobacter sp. KR3-3]|uniref:TolC family protein n=1 Tax=Pedobacter albus TaxID=3113905 RepID=A0ABU7I535_9SPHI|nr:TolC family protein [Pedobacter sp. KR3-3]MEE1944466.1 TolC family protein [Pedobacter sp. KR3-3]